MMQTQTTIRTQLSRNLLQYLERHTPDGLRSLEIQILLDLAAHAFRMPARKVWHLPADEALRAYADFTVHCMNTRHAAPRVLYRKAYIVGRRVRRITGLTDRRDAEKLVFYLYKNIRIQMHGSLSDIHAEPRDMNGSLPGEITVTDCYFSRYYTPEQCAIMSFVDSGIIAGICGTTDPASARLLDKKIDENCGIPVPAGQIDNKIDEKCGIPAPAGQVNGQANKKIDKKIDKKLDDQIDESCGYLLFTERITEGCGRCRACFHSCS